jgi:hypothetical protein
LLGLGVFLGDVAAAPPPIETKTAGFDRRDGFFPLYWDGGEGRIWLEIPRLDEEFLYVVSLPAGLGSNDVGLDRGQLGSERVVRFERVGPKVLLVMPNPRFRATSANPAERRAVREAFAESVLWGFTVAAESGGRLLVDATDFVVRDAHGVVERLKRTRQGAFKLDPSRSAPHLERTKAFADNTEMEARLTFTGEDPGNFVLDVAADPQAISLRVRHSFVRLPNAGFEPVPADPRSSYLTTGWADYAAPIGEPIARRFILRHRLVKKDPAAALSEPVKPIVYYLDPGTPEPVRTALLEGARWWEAAFEAAGFKHAFRVEMLPEGADPLDVRYNVIQWVHRATRGWSYGASVADPRTGEIIKGHVTLGSLRVRQDYLIAEGRLAPYTKNPDGPAGESADPMLAMSLARLRQLSAHEVGHTLGLLHNFAASNTGRASVMDYPAPWTPLGTDGLPRLEEAYATGIGAWDKTAIRFGYTQFAPGADARAGREAILAEARARGLKYLADPDARPIASAQPLANLWDNGKDPLVGLRTEMAARRAGLARFGEGNIRTGMPLATLEEVLVPLYLGHRYALTAASKLLGGAEYGYALRGDGQPPPKTVPASSQRAGLELLLAAVSPAELRVPPAARALIAPRPPDYERTRELFSGHTGALFDPYAPAEAVTRHTFALLCEPERAARLAYQKDFDASLPDLAEVLGAVTARIWQSPGATDPYDAALQRVAQDAWIGALLDLAAHANNPLAVRSAVHRHLQNLVNWLGRNPGTDEPTRAHRGYQRAQLAGYLKRDYQPRKPEDRPAIPPGEPIGSQERE